MQNTHLIPEFKPQAALGFFFMNSVTKPAHFFHICSKKTVFNQTKSSWQMSQQSCSLFLFHALLFAFS